MEQHTIIQTITDIGLTAIFLAVLFEAISTYREHKKDKRNKRR
jgi:hypothetical protein